jgi:hypothetical protein
VSEYQYVAFRAIDNPVSKKDLAYMRRQSTRAEVTPWSFINHRSAYQGHKVRRRGQTQTCSKTRRDGSGPRHGPKKN